MGPQNSACETPCVTSLRRAAHHGSATPCSFAHDPKVASPKLFFQPDQKRQRKEEAAEAAEEAEEAEEAEGSGLDAGKGRSANVSDERFKLSGLRADLASQPPYNGQGVTSIATYLTFRRSRYHSSSCSSVFDNLSFGV